MAGMSNAELRSALTEAHALLSRLNRKVIDDHQQAQLLPTYPDYAKHAPSVYLDRAQTKLQKQGYKVAFAGAMKSGKSTMINALLKAPDLLPAAVYECTLSLTVIGAPAPGQQERIEVTYFSRDDAIRNVIDNLRYDEIFEGKEQTLDAFDSDRALSYVHGCLGKARGDQSLLEQVEELAEFCDALEAYGSKLGTVFIDTMDNAPKYLTVDSERKGMGHLLLIQQVAIFKENPVFKENNIQVVDLPGTDSTNPRQRELTHSYMKIADVVFLVLEPKGFTEAAKRITDKLKDCNQEVRNKMFVILNRWDTLQAKDTMKEAIESLYVNEIKARTIKWGLRPDRIYLTSALWEELRQRAAQGSISTQDQGTLSKIAGSCREQFNAIDSNIVDDLRGRLETIYTDGGVTHLRTELSLYLKEEIERERMRDVYLDLKVVLDLASNMLAPERDSVQALLRDARNRLAQVGKWLDELIYRFDERLQVVDAKLEKAVTLFVGQARDQLIGGLAMLTDADNRHLSLRKIRSSLAVPSPTRIKSEAIATVKEVVASKLVETLDQVCVPPVIAKMTEETAKIGNERLFGYLDRHLDRGFEKRYERLVKEIEHDLRQATRLRAMEEAWELQETEMQPASVEGVWTDAIEAEFRVTLKDVFTERLGVHTRRLEKTLWRYYRQLLNDGLKEFERMANEVGEVLRHAADVPLPSFGGEETGLDRNTALVAYFTMLDELIEQLGAVGSDLDDGEGAQKEKALTASSSVW